MVVPSTRLGASEAMGPPASTTPGSGSLMVMFESVTLPVLRTLKA